MINLFWHKANNFGDKLSPYIIKTLTNQEINYVKKPTGKTLVAVGSVMHFFAKNKNTTNCHAWGPGFIKPTKEATRVQTAQVHALRGPHTANILREQNIECPEIYGDPAILLPLLYKPMSLPICDIGVVPHLVEKEAPALKKLKDLHKLKVIYVTDPIESVIDQICSCKAILSSSLHGLVVADAFNIPCRHIKFTPNSVIGNDFKFADYYAGIRNEYKPPILAYNTNLNNINLEFARASIDAKIRKDLLQALPFEIRCSLNQLD